jgi:hypothetical protein
MVPDEESQTVTFMQGKDSWRLTEAQAKARAEELNKNSEISQPTHTLD